MSKIEKSKNELFGRWLKERCISGPAKQERTLALFKDWEKWAFSVEPEEQRPTRNPNGTFSVFGSVQLFVAKLKSLGYERQRANYGNLIKGLELRG